MELYQLLFLILAVGGLTFFIYYQFKRQQKRTELKELKDEVIWEKKKVIHYRPALIQILRTSPQVNLLLAFMILFLSVFLLFQLLGAVISLEGGVPILGKFYVFSPAVTPQKVFYRSNTLSSNNSPKERTTNQKRIYYVAAISLEDLQEILKEEKAELSASLGTSLGKVSVELDPHHTFCANKDTLACYFNHKIFIVPQRMGSRSYYRRLIRHELIHLAEEKIAVKYETHQMEFKL